MEKKIRIIFSLCALLFTFSCATTDGDVDAHSSATPKGMTISKIQGTHHRSSYEGKEVEKVMGVVTALIETKYNNGFFMQSRIADKDERTSEGIYVENKTDIIVQLGDLVSVSGVVKEMQFSKPKPEELTITSISANKVELLKTDIKVKPVYIEAKKIPHAIKTDSLKRKLNIKKNAMDFYESYEGMLVAVANPLIVGCKEKYGDIAIIPDGGKYAKNRTNNGGVKYSYDNEQTQRILISDKLLYIHSYGKFKDTNFTPNPGDKFSGDVVGVLSFDYNNYKLYNIEELPKIIDCGAKVDKVKFTLDKNSLSVATYNIENFTLKDGPKRIKDLAIHIEDHLQTPDIIGLVEVADDDGSKKGSKLVSANKTLQAIVDAIKAETGIEYKYLTVNPEHGKDGGWPEMHIRNAILYRSDRVSLPYFKQGNAEEDLSLASDGKLTFNPGRIGNDEEIFEDGRKPVIAHLKAFDRDIFVIVNHLKSKRGDNPLYGAIQPVQRKTEEEKRIPQAQYIAKFMEEIYNDNPDAVILCMGDMNDFEFSPAMTILKGEIMINALDLLPEEERHTYVYNGNSQVLDALLVNKEFEDDIQADVLNINSEFTKSQGALSDHDPILIQIKMK